MSATFYNWSDSEFTHAWNSKDYTFAPGRVYSDFVASADGSSKVILEPGIAAHFAKHLGVREATKKGIDLGLINVVEELIAKALTLPNGEAVVGDAPPRDPDVKEDDSEVESAVTTPKPRGRKPALAAA